MMISDIIFKDKSLIKTNEYLNRWDNSSPFGCPDNVKIRDVFCLPNVTVLNKNSQFPKYEKNSIIATEILEGASTRDINILAITGPAGSGKTVLLSYWIKQIVSNSKKGIVVVDLFKKDYEKALGILLGELEKYAVNHNFTTITIIIEDIDYFIDCKLTQGLFINRLNKITQTYEKINFIITGRHLNLDTIDKRLVHINIEPFSYDQIMFVSEKICEALRYEDFAAYIKELMGVFGKSNLENPLLLSYIIGNGVLLRNVNSMSELYCFVFDQFSNDINYMLSDIAWKMFISGTDELEMESENKKLEQIGAITIDSLSKIRFVHESIYDYYLAKWITDYLLDCTDKNDINQRLRAIFGYYKFKPAIFENIKTLFDKDPTRTHKTRELLQCSFNALLEGDFLYTEISFLNETKSLLTAFYNQFMIIHNVFESYDFLNDLLRGKYKEAFRIYMRLHSAFFDEMDFDFSNLNLSGCDFSNLNMSKIILEGCCLDACVFDFTNLSNASFKEASICNANLANANLVNTDLSYTDLKKVNLQKANLMFANLSCANLEGANLRGANLSNSLCSSANFRGVNLERGSLEGAYCGSCNFTLANLMYSNCARCNFEKAIFDRTNLINAELRDANLSGGTVINVLFNKTVDNKE